jgi:DNA polymerase-3 subunit delta'
MSEPAQNALLKSLEEPPAQTHIILAAADDASLLPTIRSRCATIRLGLPDTAAASELIATRLGLDAATATRLLRMSGGRPGPLIDAEASGDAARAHAALRRQILDFVGTAPHARLRQIPALIADARAILAASTPEEESGALDEDEGETADAGTATAASNAKKTPAKRAGAKPTPAERRANAKALLILWRGVARDLALVASSAPGSIAFPEDLDELTPVAARCTQTAWRDALISLDRALAALRRNGNPELLLDAIALRWPRG